VVPAWVNPESAPRCPNVVNVPKAREWANQVVLVWVNPENVPKSRLATNLVAKMAMIKVSVAKNATKTKKINATRIKSAKKISLTRKINPTRKNLKSLTKIKKVKNNFWG
jgi:hypothetical protein